MRVCGDLELRSTTFRAVITLEKLVLTTVAATTALPLRARWLLLITKLTRQIPSEGATNERLVAMWGAKSMRIVVGSRHWSSIAPNNTFTNTSSSILTQQASQRAHLQVFDVGLVPVNRGAASCTSSL